MHTVSFVIFVLATISYARVAPLYESRLDSIMQQYIVVYKDNINDQDFELEMQTALGTYEVLHRYEHVLKGYAAKLNDAQISLVRNNPLVSFVEVDQVMKASDCAKPVAAGSWGLTRISEQTQVKIDKIYSYPTNAGEGVIAYVVDTGIYVENEDFAGRASFGFKSDKQWSDTDANGHGTHVSSTIVGEKYGVAKKATVVGVKVLGDDGSGSTSGVIAGVDFVIGQFKQNKKPSVINMSLGGGFSSALNRAVDNAFKGGVTVVVAAGNEDTDACDSSPAGASLVLSVGATENDDGSDVRSYFSNYGSCVHVFAPGSAITGAWIGSPSATNTISGTSMASPHVAGVAVLTLGENPSATPKEVKESIIADATANIIKLNCEDDTTCDLSPNLLTWNGCTHH